MTNTYAAVGFKERAAVQVTKAMKTSLWYARNVYSSKPEDVYYMDGSFLKVRCEISN
jgi:hypothetical protein